MSAGRLFAIVNYLLAHPRASAAELARRFEVSTRTIYRDVETLSAAGVPVYAERGRGGGVRLMEDYALGKALFTEEEQDGLLSALSLLSATAALPEKALLEKLSALFRRPAADWIDVDFCRWGSETAERAAFETIRRAIWEKRLLRFDYLGAGGKTAGRVIRPAKLTFKHYAWYLQGFCLLRGAYRTFKIARMRGVEALEERFVEELNPPPIAEMSDDGNRLWVTLRLAPEMEMRLLDEFYGCEIEREPDGAFRVRAQLADGDWLVHYLLSFGARLSVLDPPELRTALAQAAAQVLIANR